MRLFGHKGKVEDSDAPEPGEYTARIEITGKGKTRKVKAMLINRGTGATDYKAEYGTSKSDIFAYHVALEALQKHAEYEGYEIVKKSTNAEMGYVRNVSKRMR